MHFRANVAPGGESRRAADLAVNARFRGEPQMAVVLLCVPGKRPQEARGTARRQGGVLTPGWRRRASRLYGHC